MEDAVIVSAVRTPVGSFGGQFKDVAATQLGAQAVRAALERADIAGEDVDEVLLGCVLTAGLGQNPARQAAIGAGIPNKVPATKINMVCGSGLKAVAIADDPRRRRRDRRGRRDGKHDARSVSAAVRAVLR